MFSLHRFLKIPKINRTFSVLTKLSFKADSVSVFVKCVYTPCRCFSNIGYPFQLGHKQACPSGTPKNIGGNNGITVSVFGA